MVNSVYNYYQMTYASKETTRFDTHKRSELKDLYSAMLKVNRKSPLYKFDKLRDVEKYAIDIKEATRDFRNVAASFGGMNGMDAFSIKKATSSDESVLTAKYIGDDEDSETGSLDLLVTSTAKPQINKGHFLNSDKVGLTQGSYSFDFSIGQYTYEFSFDVAGGETNKDVQDKLAKLINRADIGVAGSVESNSEGQSALVIRSLSTGVSNLHSDIFEIKDNENSEDGPVVSALGLDQISTKAADAVFYVGGEVHNSHSNHFTLGGKYEIQLLGESKEGQSATVALKPDLDAIIENVSEVVNSYNAMIGLARSHTDGSFESERLMREINRVVNVHKDGLESSGFLVQDDGSIKIESSLLIQSEREDTLAESLEQFHQFRNDLVKKSGEISLNPMEYVQKKLIAYPNPVKSFTNPYISSIYSGMMFNGYI